MGWGRQVQRGALSWGELAKAPLHGLPPASPKGGVVEGRHFACSHDGGSDLHTCTHCVGDVRWQVGMTGGGGKRRGGAVRWGVPGGSQQPNP